MALETVKLKELLGIAPADTEKDAGLEFIIADVEETILNYCNIKAMPHGLLNTAYRMAVDLYRNEAFGSEILPSGSVTSIKEGDTQVSFNKSADENFHATLLKNYTAQLNRYRKLSWR